MGSFKKDLQKASSGFGNKYYAFGMQVAVTFGFYVLGGVWLDKRFDTLPLFLIIGVVFAGISFGYFIKKLYDDK